MSRLLGGVVLAVLLPCAAFGQVSERELLEGLGSPDLDVVSESVSLVQQIPPHLWSAELETSLISALERALDSRVAREGAWSSEQSLETSADLIDLVARIESPAVVPVMLGALGTGRRARESLARFADQALPGLVEVARDPESPLAQVVDAYLTFGAIAESGRLGPHRDDVLGVVAEGMRDSRSRVLVRRAMEVGAVIGSPELLQTIQEYASSSTAVREAGFPDEADVAYIQRHARRLVSG